MQRCGNLSSTNFLKPLVRYTLPYVNMSILLITLNHGEIWPVNASPWTKSTRVPGRRVTLFNTD
jgi:hypothetical protein